MDEFNKTRKLFDRIATAIENNEIPTVEDSAALECLVLGFWESNASPKMLGLTNRVANRVVVDVLEKGEILSIINHFVQQKKPNNGPAFGELIRLYLNKDITAVDLLRERNRKPRNGRGWSYYDQQGEVAEKIKSIVSKPKFLTGNRSISDGSNTNLYDLLSDLSNPCLDLNLIRNKYKLPSSCKLERIDTGFHSASQWRDYHLEYKKY